MLLLAKTIKRAGFGFLVGAAVGNVIAALMGWPAPFSSGLVDKVGNLSAAILLQTGVTGLIGAVSFGAIGLYDAERLPLLLSAVIHYLCYMAVYIPASLLLCWFSKLGEALVMAAILAVIHFLIFLGLYIRYRREVRELNEMQRTLLKNQRHGGKQ